MLKWINYLWYNSELKVRAKHIWHGYYQFVINRREAWREKNQYMSVASLRVQNYDFSFHISQISYDKKGKMEFFHIPECFLKISYGAGEMAQ